MNPLLAQMSHRPFPAVAAAIRSSVDQITLAWDAAVRKAMPQMQRLSFDELKDSTPQILVCIADALASDDPAVIRELIARAPSQGLSRFRLNFDVTEVMQEDRLLRAITVQHVEARLDRRMDEPEAAALHAAIDVMLQRSVIALVDQQKLQLRAAAESELKFLSFLSHDLSNNLNSVTMTLQSLGLDLQQLGNFPQAEESLEIARQCIFDTVAGMRRLLEHERLRQSANGSALVPVELHALATKLIAQFSRQAEGKSVKLSVDIRPGTVIDSEADLLTLVLQNLIGNGVKYSSRGTVHIGFEAGHDTQFQAIWVSDQGPGIAPDKVGTIFKAYNRGDAHGEPGLGLGLAIASQAANLLGAHLTVESQPGLGSTFRLLLPIKANAPTKASSPTTLLVS